MDQRRYGKHKYEFAVEERMIEFRVHPRSKFDQTPPVLRKPLYLGDFSLDGKRKFCHDKRNLSYINVDFESSKQGPPLQ
ncbi:hypothetical protein SK128_012684 [Halocaridina rubra]|uniref:Uncharacterized protein n=1 Tax=Halocaridina rubra TaxID=373956 RepID=A0AAN8X3T9_HALRR